jgi:hypothetical protein
VVRGSASRTSIYLEIEEKRIGVQEIVLVHVKE